MVIQFRIAKSGSRYKIEYFDTERGPYYGWQPLVTGMESEEACVDFMKQYYVGIEWISMMSGTFKRPKTMEELPE